MVAKVVGSNPMKEVEKEIEDGATVYECDYEVAGKERSMKCAETGELVELEHEVEADSLPPAVLQVLTKNFPGASIEEVEMVQLFFYEVELEIDGKKIEVKILPSGGIEDQEDEEDDDDDEDEEHES